METPLYTTLERFEFQKRRIAEYRAEAQKIRERSAEGSLEREENEKLAEKAELIAEIKERTLQVLFPERFT